MPKLPWWALFCLVIGCRSEAKGPAGGQLGARQVVVTLIGTAEIHGTTEPCGCNSNPLGDLARVVSLAQGGLWLDGGGLLYEEGGTARPQADLKATELGKICAQAEVGLGPEDLLHGIERVVPVRHAANVPAGLPLKQPIVREVKGIRVGIFGVVAPGRVARFGLSPTQPEAAAQKAVARLRKAGAQLVVGLLGMNRAEARALCQAVEGIDFGLIGAEVGEGMAEAEPVGRGFLVAPADQGRRVARIELHVVDGQVALTPFGGEAARLRERERLRRRTSALTVELARWKSDPSADLGFVKARKQELAELERRAMALEQERPTPPSGSYFTYALEPVRRTVPRDPRVAASLKALDRAIGKANLQAAVKLPPPAAEAGKPHFVGRTACEKCHQTAVQFWKGTVHARAWQTLVDLDKQYNYDCIGCHVTGWQKPGGSHLAAVEKAGLVDVQCEVCHGPGSLHVAEAGLEEPKTLTLRPADRFCAENCHTKEHSDTFDLIPYLRDVLGKGHGEKRRTALGAGVTGHELRQKALAAAANH